jgi:hypothetical protein
MARAFFYVSGSKKRLTLLGATIMFVVTALGAVAYYSNTGSGANAAGTTDNLTAATISAPSTSSGTQTITWTSQASLTTSSQNSNITYTVQRKLGAGAYADVTSGPCATPLPYGTASCADTVSVGGTYTYRVVARFNSWTATSNEVSVVVTTDATPPTSSITFPSASYYNTAGYNTGCSTPSIGDICGTANDPGAGASGVNKVQVSIQRSSDSKYWNGSTWMTSGTTVWNNATTSDSWADWSYALSATNLDDGVSYTVKSQAIDNASNTQTTPDSKTFTFDTTAPTLVSINRTAGSTNPTNSGPLSWTVTFSEPVSNLVAADFAIAASAGITGAPSIQTPTAVGGAPSATWTVTATTVGVTGANGGTIGLNLASAGTIQDQAGNGLATSSFTGQTFTFDTTKPNVTINQAAGQTDPSKTSPINFTVVFDEPINVSSFSAGGVLLSGTAGATTAVISQIAPNDGTIFNVAVSGMTSDGTVIASIPAGGVSDQAGNTNTTSTSTDSAVTYDTTAPTVTSITRAAASPTNASTLPFTVAFSEPVNTSGVVAARFSVTTSGVSGGPPTVGTITPIAPSGGFATSYTVNVNTNGATGTNSGSVRLDQTSSTGINDQAGNALTGTHNADQSYNYDTTAPTVSSINIAGTSPTNASTLPFTVTFSEPVNTAGVVAGRFTVTTTNVSGTAPTVGTITPIAPSGGFATSYTVNVTTTGAVGANNGTVRLDQTSSTGINDQAGNGVSGTHNGDQSYSFDTTAPTVSSINIAGTSSTNASTLPFTVTFSEPVNTAAVVAARFAVTTSNVSGGPPTVGTITPVAPSGGFATSYTVNVNSNGATGANNGSVRLDLTTVGSIQDQATNALAATHNGDQSYVYDTTAPTVSSINRAAGSTNPTSTGPLAFTLTFSEPVNTAAVVAGRFSVTTSGVTGTAPTLGTITPVSPSGGFATSYTVNVNTTGAVGANNGSIQLDLTSVGTIQDPATNALAASHNGDQSYTYDTTAPTVSSINIASTSPTNAGPLPFTVTFSEPVNTGAVVAGRFTITTSNVSGGPPTVGTITPISASGGFATTYTVNVNTNGATGTNSGSVRLDLSTVGTIQDQATNSLAAAHSGDQFYTYDTTAPTLSSINRAGASSSVNSGPLTWTVTFSEPVNGVTTSNFTLATSNTGGTAPSITAAVASGGAPSATWTVSVSVSGTTGTNSGSIGLNLANNTNIKDAATNSLTTSTFTGQTYTYDTTAPTVTITSVNGSVRTFPYSTNVNVSSIGGTCTNGTGDLTPITVTFNGAGTNPASATCTAGAWTLNLTTQISAENTYSVLASESDQAGNSGTNTQTIVIDKTAPQLVSIQANNAGATAGLLESGDKFVLTFGEALDPSTVPSTATVTYATDSNQVLTITSNVLTGSVSFTAGTGYLDKSRSVTATGSTSLSADHKTMTITFTSLSGDTGKLSQGSGLPPSGSTLSPISALKDVAGNSATGSQPITTGNGSPNTTRLF